MREVEIDSDRAAVDGTAIDVGPLTIKVPRGPTESALHVAIKSMQTTIRSARTMYPKLTKQQI
ncbi:hypothetical protein Bphyt_1200 [Paraburkholderia phytofirmans PsJN]|uniref:Uncharacterized protein n=1 Tax=Paraburkholderia phytofirmans (strain DSM 17436 / LMG 22146 / PsJN) TaxID=398527 RepID=B2T204_PARPJ|nr:hypothetical protein Bphyt_1200 [Paraburkholderia phytofirmans PsJN]